MKKIRYFLMTIIFTLLLTAPLSVQAAGVATINGKAYSSLKDAVAHVKNNQTIKLQTDIKSYYDFLTIKTNKTFSLDLNKHTWSQPIAINGGNITIKNGNIGGTALSCVYVGYEFEKILSLKDGTKTSATFYNVTTDTYITGSEKSTMVFKSGTYKDNILVFGKATVKKGTFNETKHGRNFYVGCGGTLVIENGKFINNRDNIDMTDGFDGVFQSNASKRKTAPKLTIQNGTFTSNGENIEGSGVVQINGGTFTSKSRAITFTANKKEPYKGAKFTMNGGSIKCDGNLIIDNFYLNGGKLNANGFYSSKATIKKGTLTLHAVPSHYSVHGLYGADLMSASVKGSLTMSGGSIIADTIPNEYANYFIDSPAKLFGDSLKIKMTGGTIQFTAPTGGVIGAANTGSSFKGKVVLIDTTPFDNHPLTLRASF